MGRIDERNIARRYAQALLADLGIVAQPQLADEHPALAWARSGLMRLTGLPDGEPLMCPAPLAACADGVLAALAAIAPSRSFADLRGSELLAERAAIAGFSRAGAVSPGGSCRLLQTADGWIAVNLAREDDWALLPAWLEEDIPPTWPAVSAVLRARATDSLIERGRLLGLALAPDEAPCARPVRWFNKPDHGEQAARGPLNRKPRVVDLSSLWAGPLCGHLLHCMGAEVIKVESPRRPDGARLGPAAFFDLLNAGKRCVAIDVTSVLGRAQLMVLLSGADIVIESSRPRALRQLGICVENLIVCNPGLVWISLTGHGRSEPQENWIAYGDDAGVAAGLSQLMFTATGEHLIVGDAIADPLAGLHGALAAWAAWRSGQRGLISIALSEVVRHCIRFDLPGSPEAIRERQLEWTRLVERGAIEVPRVRRAAARAHGSGADTAAVFSELNIDLAGSTKAGGASRGPLP